jgi:hypothetical protein
MATLEFETDCLKMRVFYVRVETGNGDVIEILFKFE